MNKSKQKTLLELLGELSNHRVGNAIRHQLKDIIAIGILAIMCNANTFVGMQRQALLEIQKSGIIFSPSFSGPIIASGGMFPTILQRSYNHAGQNHYPPIDGKTGRRT